MLTHVSMIDSLSPDNLGGGERLAALIAMELDPARYRRILVSTRPSHGPVADQVRAAGVRLVELQRSGRAAVRPWAELRRLLRSERVDIVHAHKFGSNVWGTLVGRLARVPVVVAHEHTWSYEGQPLRRFLDRELVGRGADAFLAVSREDRRRMIEIEGVKPEKAVFLPIGIPPLPRRTGRDLRAELGIPPDAPVIGTVCALRPQKALGVLVRAAAQLRAARPDLVVLIAGGGPEEEPVRALAQELGVAENVRLLGFWPPDDVPDLLAALDVAVNSSDFEGSPLGIMEFMAAGTPVVATAVGGTPDLIEDGADGLLVPRGDHVALAAGIERLLADRELAARLASSARDKQAREFSLAALVGRLDGLYADLLARKRR